MKRIGGVLLVGLAAIALFAGCSKSSGTYLFPEGNPIRSPDSSRIRADFRFDAFTDRKAYSCFNHGVCNIEPNFNVYAFDDSIVDLTIDTVRIWGGGLDSSLFDGRFEKYNSFRGDTVTGRRVEGGYQLFCNRGVDVRRVKGPTVRIRFRARLARPGGLMDTLTLEQLFRVERWSETSTTGP